MTRSFGRVIRERRPQLDLTQEDVARSIKISLIHFSNVEAGKRHPSEEIVAKLANVLGLDPRELFLLANPVTRTLISERSESGRVSAWDAFVRDKKLREIKNITDLEMAFLSKIAMMGDVRNPRDFAFISTAFGTL